MDLNLVYFDREVSKRRIDEIDRIRANGGKTELEIWWRNVDKRSEKAKKTKYGSKFYVSILNTDTKIEKHYTSFKQCCQEHNFQYSAVKYRLYKSTNKKIVFENYVIKKIDEKDLRRDLVVAESRDKYKGNKNWSERDMAILVKNKNKGLKWKDTSHQLRKNEASCSAKYHRLKGSNLIDYYLNLDIEDVKSLCTL